MIGRSFQEQILAHLDSDSARTLARLDSKSVEDEFMSVVQLLADAPDLRWDEKKEQEYESQDSLVDRVVTQVTANIINLFAPVLAKIESKLLQTDNDSMSVSDWVRSDASMPIKRVVKHQGFAIGITHEKNAIRFPYSLPLSAGYGHIRRSYGQAEDKKAIDVYWGGDNSSTDIYRVRQIDPDTGFVTEHDYFMGFGGEDASKSIRDLYFRHLGHKRFGGLEKVNPDDLSDYRVSEQSEESLLTTDAISEGSHWVSGYVRRNWWEEKKPGRNDNDSMSWDNLRYDAPDRDDWDAADYVIDRTMHQSGKIFNRWLATAQNWVKEQGSLEEARDRIHELYAQLDGKKLTQALEEGMVLADLGGRLAVVEESAEDEEEADSVTETEGQDDDARVEGG